MQTLPRQPITVAGIAGIFHGLRTICLQQNAGNQGNRDGDQIRSLTAQRRIRAVL